MRVLLIILVLMSSTQASAQDYQFRLDGSFAINSEILNPTTVNFTVSWNEEDNRITGIYSDNYFTGIDNATVEGNTGTHGRSFNIVFPNISRGARSLTLLATTVGLETGTTSVSISPRNDLGEALATYNIAATITLLRSASEPSSPTTCTVGFGDLTGFCGLYAGNILKVQDPLNRCHQINSRQTRLAFSPEGDFALYLQYTDTLVGLPLHNLGSMPISPSSNLINQTSHNCGPLAGTSLNNENCQRLTLEGSFTNYAGVKSFAGSYTIEDEENEETCSYSLNLTMERDW
jgi:hypothetical protein